MNFDNITQEELFQHASDLIANAHNLPPEEAKLDSEYGFNIMNKLSMDGFADAQYYIGNYFHYVLKNPEGAFEYYYASSLNGSIKGKYMTAIFLKDGLGGQQNKKEAFHLMYQLAQANIDYAQLDLALFYLHGDGCEKNLNEAFKYFELSAYQGHKVAQFDLALSYLNGEGTQQNYDKAFYWFNQSALQGYGQSYYNMGVMFMHGLGREKDMNRAFDYFILGAKVNDINSIALLESYNIDIKKIIN